MMVRVLFMLCLLALLGAGLFRVWVNQDAVQMGYELSAEARRSYRLRNEIKKFRVELAVLKSPERLNAYAAKIGLRAPTSAQIYAHAQRAASVEAGAEQ